MATLKEKMQCINLGKKIDSFYLFYPTFTIKEDFLDLPGFISQLIDYYRSDIPDRFSFNMIIMDKGGFDKKEEFLAEFAYGMFNRKVSKTTRRRFNELNEAIKEAYENL